MTKFTAELDDKVIEGITDSNSRQWRVCNNTKINRANEKRKSVSNYIHNECVQCDKLQKKTTKLMLGDLILRSR